MNRTPWPGSAGIPHWSFRLGERAASLEELHQAGLLTTEPGVLEDFGFRRCRVHGEADATELMLGAARTLLEGGEVERERVSALFVYSGLPPAPAPEPGPMAPFRYDLARIRHELDLAGVPAYRLSQQGCCGLLSTVRLAGQVLAAEGGSTALVLTGESFGPGAHREILYNVMSDAGSAVLVDPASPRNRLLAVDEIVQTWYWDAPARSQEILAAYFPLAQRVIERVLATCGTELDELRWIVPHNVSRRSWEILCDVIGADPSRVWTGNIPEVGHTVSSDHLINLSDMARAGALEPGDRLLLFTFGFGAAWSAAVMEH